MSSDDKKPTKTLNESEITAERKPARRAMLGMMLVGGAAATTACVVVPGPVPGPGPGLGADSDNGNWTDHGNCPRGPRVNYNTGITDQDNGNWTDLGGRGRGAPYC